MGSEPARVGSPGEGLVFLRDARVPETARGGRFEMRQEFLIVSSLPLRLDPIDHDSLLAAEGHQHFVLRRGAVGSTKRPAAWSRRSSIPLGSISREKRQRAGMCGIAFLWRGARLELRAVATSTEAR